MLKIYKIQITMLLGDKIAQLCQIIQYDQNLITIPPTQLYSPLTGKLTLLIKLDYLNLPFEKSFQYRYSLWGSHEKIYFQSFKSQLKTTASLQSLSKYIWDMNILCVEIVSILDSKQENSLTNTIKRKTLNNQNSQKQKRIVGYAYIPLRKYFVNHIFNSFSSQKFVVIDQNKKRLGQMGIQLRIEMLQKNGIKFKQYINQHNSYSNKLSLHLVTPGETSIQRNQITSNRAEHEQSQNNLKRKQKKVMVNKNQQILSNIKFSQKSEQNINQYKQIEKDLVQNKYAKKNYFSHEDVYLGQQHSQRQIINEVQNDEDINQNIISEDYYKKSKKGTIKNIMNIDYLQKAQHSDLSLIRMKWGNNYPSIQLMKLRLDQAKYLQKNRQNVVFESQEINQLGQLKIILKSLTYVVGKVNSTQTKYLSISYSSESDSKVLSKTQLNLEALSKNQALNSIALNHLIILNFPILKDRLILQTFDTKDEVLIKSFINHSVLDLRKRQNKKRLYELNYQIIFSNSQNQRQNEVKHLNQGISDKFKNANQKNKLKINQNKQVGKRTKQINRILNEKDLPGKKGYSKQKKNIVIPQRQNGQRAPSDLKSPYNKFLIESNVQKISQAQQKQKYNIQQSMILVFKYFEILYNCQDENCFQIINKLIKSSQSEENQKLMKKLQQRINLIQQRNENKSKNSQNINALLEQLIKGLFEGSFKEFYQTFLSYKVINQRYQTIIYKLNKVLLFPTHQDYQQRDLINIKDNQNYQKRVPLIIINAVLDYIKKYKKDLIHFGLIKYQHFIAILRSKYHFNHKQQRIVTEKQQNSIVADNKEQKQKQNEKEHQKQDYCKQQQKSKIQEEVFRFIEAFLILFSRYESDFIKITEIQSFINNVLANSQKNKNQQICKDANININFGLMANICQQMNQSQEKIDYTKLTDSKLYKMLQKHAQTLKNRAIPNFKNVEFKICDLIFNDPLTLEQLKSSLHFSNYRQQQFSGRRIITEQQSHYPRIKTQQQGQNRLITQQEKNTSNHEQRLNTSQFSNKEKKRLNSEQDNIINLINKNKQDMFRRQNEKSSIAEQMIGIQITKKQQFKIDMDPQNKQSINKISEQNNSIILQSSRLKNHRPQTKYISIKCSIKKAQNDQAKSQKYFFNQKYSDQISQISLFYLNKKKNSKHQIISQEHKIQVNKINKKQSIYPNSLNINFTGQDQSPEFQQFLRFRFQDLSKSNQKTSLIYKKIQNNHLSVKNMLGSEDYAIQDQQGKVFAILTVQIEEVNSLQQKQFQEEIISSQQKTTNQKNSVKFNTMIFLNVNKLICLDQFQTNFSFRMILQNFKGELICVRNIEDNVQNQAETTNQNLNLKRFLELSISNIKLSLPQKRNQTYYLKIFKFNKTNQNQRKKQNYQNQGQQNLIQQNTFSRKNKFSKTKTSLPLSRRDNNLNEAHLDLLCQFQFQLDIKAKQCQQIGIRKQKKWLLDQKFRLQLSLYQVKYQKWINSDNQNNKYLNKNNQNQEIWTKKVQKIINVFNHQILTEIRFKFAQLYQKSQTKLNYQAFLQLLSQCMKYRLTQRQIFQTLCFPCHDQPQQGKIQLTSQFKLMFLLNLFQLNRSNRLILRGNDSKSGITSLSQLYEEFQTFDLQHHGLLTLLKCQVVKKVVPQLQKLQINQYCLAKKYQLQKNENNQLLSTQINGAHILQEYLTSCNMMNDCRISQKQKKNSIDYLHVLWDARLFYNDDFFNDNAKILHDTISQNKKNKMRKQEQNLKRGKNQIYSWEFLPEYYGLRLKQFKNLKLNDNPCTLQFEINKNKLFEPVYRCYSNKFQEPLPSLAVKVEKQNQETYKIKILNRLVSLDKKKSKQEMYEYKLIDEIDLRRYLKNCLKNMNGQSIQQYKVECENLQGFIIIEIESFQNQKQFNQYKNILGRMKNQLDLQEQVLKDDRRQLSNLKQSQNKLFQKEQQISSLLKKQFYENQDQQQQEGRQKIIRKKQIRNKKKMIGQSVLDALNQKSQFKQKQTNNKNIINKLNQSNEQAGQEKTLEKTRKQWQQMLEQSRINKKYKQNLLDQNEQNQDTLENEITKKNTIYDVLKQQIDRNEIENKFSKFNDDSSSDQNDYQ